MHALLALRGKLMLAYFGPNVLRFSVKQIFPLWGKIMKLAEIDQSGSIGQSSPGGTGGRGGPGGDSYNLNLVGCPLSDKGPPGSKVLGNCVFNDKG